MLERYAYSDEGYLKERTIRTKLNELDLRPRKEKVPGTSKVPGT